MHALQVPESALQQRFQANQEVAFEANCRYGYSEHFPPTIQRFGEFDDKYEYSQDSLPIQAYMG